MRLGGRVPCSAQARAAAGAAGPAQHQQRYLLAKHGLPRRTSHDHELEHVPRPADGSRYHTRSETRRR